ncbi:MAG TPA: TetR/AcrR family transcriptional regulator [bacterium]|nr:TetR/AcrR family transcriptional regulator [bacterium]
MPRVTAAVKAKLSETRRAQILEAAVRVFARRGFDRATVKDIARSAKLSEGSIYNYFRSKEELLVHIPHHLVRPALVPLLETTAAPATIAEVERQLLLVAEGIVGRIKENAWFLKVFVSALPRLSPSARERYMSLLPLYAAEKLEDFLREGIRRGLFRDDLDPMIAARAFPGMLIIFLMMQEVLLEKKLIPHDYATIAEETVRLFLYGATSRHGHPSDRP